MTKDYVDQPIYKNESFIWGASFLINMSMDNHYVLEAGLKGPTP